MDQRAAGSLSGRRTRGLRRSIAVALPAMVLTLAGLANPGPA